MGKIRHITTQRRLWTLRNIKMDASGQGNRD